MNRTAAAHFTTHAATLVRANDRPLARIRRALVRRRPRLFPDYLSRAWQRVVVLMGAATVAAVVLAWLPINVRGV